MKTLGILASGSGTTAEFVATELERGHIYGVEIGCVISSRGEKYAAVAGKMRRMGIPTSVVRLKDFLDDPLGFGERVLEILGEYGVTHVLQQGWLPHTPSNVIQAYEGRIFNQHPGKTPEFGGEKMSGAMVHDVVLRFREKLLATTGRLLDRTMVVAHRVTDKKDEGSIVKAAYVPILKGDTVTSLLTMAPPMEWKVQLELIRDIASDAVHEEVFPPLLLPGEEGLLQEAYMEALAARTSY